MLNTTTVEVQKSSVLPLTQRDEGDSEVESPSEETSTESPPKADSPTQSSGQTPRHRKHGPGSWLTEVQLEARSKVRVQGSVKRPHGQIFPCHSP